MTPKNPNRPHMAGIHSCTSALCGVLLMTLLNIAAADYDSVEAYLDLPLEELLSLEVSSVTKRPQPLAEAAAAVYVVTREDIRRSGVTSIPEALRMAPGVHVARINANQWAVSIRGFNGRFTNKLLVLMDGRSVYTPAFSGVYWDAQDTLLEDIERIEVIRGPGATLWGANAVNGVINVITRHAQDTQGGWVNLGVGNEEEGFAGFRYGGHLADGTYGRFYVKGFERDAFTNLSDGDDAGDDWRSRRAGFRVDGAHLARNSWTLQGDVYDNDENQFDTRFPPVPRKTDIDSSGWNLLGRWERRLSEYSLARVQVYYDHTERDESFLDQIHDTLDIEFDHGFPLGERHNILWGLGYRNIRDDFDNTPRVSFIPDKRSIDLFSAFIQDDIELVVERLSLTLGSKFEHNDYTGFEYQPNVRLLWTPRQDHYLWASVSRAVRTPSRFERDGNLQTVPGAALLGDGDFGSEELLAYELGYRAQLTPQFSFDVAVFYNDYDDLHSFEPVPPFFPAPSLVFENRVRGETYGVELALAWQPLDWWRIQASYGYLKVTLHTDASSLSRLAETVGEGSDPPNQFSLRSSMDLDQNWQLDLWAYYVDNLPVASVSALDDALGVDSYLSLNARVAWKPSTDLELSVVGQNLLDDRHLEFVGEAFVTPTEVERSVYGQVRWEF